LQGSQGCGKLALLQANSTDLAQGRACSGAIARCPLQFKGRLSRSDSGFLYLGQSRGCNAVGNN